MPPRTLTARRSASPATDVATKPAAGERHVHCRLAFAFRAVRAEPASTLVEAVAYPSFDPPAKGVVSTKEAWRVDTYGTFMRPATLTKFAHDFMVQGRAIDSDHDHGVIGALVESYITREGDPEYPGAVWVAKVRVTDPATRARIAKQDLRGLSIEFFSIVREVKVTFDGKVGKKKLGEIVDPLPVFLSLVENPAIRIGFNEISSSDGAELEDDDADEAEEPNEEPEGEDDDADEKPPVAAKKAAAPVVSEWGRATRADAVIDRIGAPPALHFWRCASTPAGATRADAEPVTPTHADADTTAPPEEPAPMEIQSPTPIDPPKKDETAPAPAAAEPTTELEVSPQAVPASEGTTPVAEPATSPVAEEPAPVATTTPAATLSSLSADFERHLIARVTLAARGVKTDEEFTPEVAAEIRKRAESGDGFAAIWAEKKAMTTLRAVAQAAEWTFYCVMDDIFWDYDSTDEGKVDELEVAAQEFADAMKVLCAEARTALAARAEGKAVDPAAPPVTHAARVGKALSQKNLDRLSSICSQLSTAQGDLASMITEYSAPADGEVTTEGTAQMSADAQGAPAAELEGRAAQHEPERVPPAQVQSDDVPAKSAREVELEREVQALRAREGELERRLAEFEDAPAEPRSRGENNPPQGAQGAPAQRSVWTGALHTFSGGKIGSPPPRS